MSADSEPLLSDDETDALLAAMREGGGSTGPTAEGIDLTSTEPRLREALRSTDTAMLEFSNSVRKLMLRHAGCSAEIRPEATEITPYSMIKDGSSPAGGAVIAKTPDGGMIFLVAGPSLSSLIIDRRLGAPLKLDDEGNANEITRTSLSEVDRRIFRPFAEDVVQQLGVHLADRGDLFKVSDVVDPANLPLLNQFEPLLQLSLIVSPIGHSPDRLMIGLTASALSSIASEKLEEEPPEPTATDRQNLTKSIGNTQLMLEAILGEVPSSIRHLLALQCGDIVRLDSIPSKPTPIRTEGVTVLAGMPVVHHGNLAIEVSDHI